MIDGNKSSSLVFIAIIVGVSGLVVSQYFTYSDRLTRFESQLEAANEQLADLNQYRSLENAEIRYWFAGYSGAPTYRTITVYIKNTGTMNFLITDSFVNETHKTFLGGSTRLESRWVYAGSGWRRYSVSIRWVESTEENPICYHIQFVTHRGNMYETFAIPDEDHYWVRPEV